MSRLDNVLHGLVEAHMLGPRAEADDEYQGALDGLFTSSIMQVSNRLVKIIT
jgi:hypothetical protein